MHPTTPTTSRGARRLAAAAGVASATVTLGLAHLAAQAVGPSSSPLAAVGSAFVDATPAWLKEAAIAAFSTNDKLALVVGMLVVLMALAAGAGVLALRRPGLGTATVVGLGAVGAAAAATRADAGTLAVVPSLLGTAAGVMALRALIRRIGPSRGSQATDSPDRRAFLTLAVVVTVAGAVAAAAGQVVGSAGRAATAAREVLRLPAAKRPAPPVPAAAQSPVAGVVDVVTRAEDFYRIDTALALPQIDPATWTLRVHGLVDTEVTLTFADLLAADLVEAYVTLTCVSNPIGGDLAGNALWLGLPVREVLAMAGPHVDADMVLSTSIDGFTASTPLEVLTDDRDALLAVGMNGAPLPVEHGFPVRMVVPGLYGYVSATKWVTDLEVTRFADQEAYWTVRGWSPLGPVKTASRIEVPRQGTEPAAGPIAVGGTAWAQHRGIAGVQVQVDDGPWQDAELAAEISVDTWRQWSWTWDAEPGQHVLQVRAVTADGEVQTGESADVVPDGATGYDHLTLTVV